MSAMSSVTRVAMRFSVLKRHPLRRPGRFPGGCCSIEVRNQFRLDALLHHSPSRFADSQSQEVKSSERYEGGLNRAREVRLRKESAERHGREGDQRETGGELRGHDVVPPNGRGGAGWPRRDDVRRQTGRPLTAATKRNARDDCRKRLGPREHFPVDHLSAGQVGSFRISSTKRPIGNFGQVSTAYAARRRDVASMRGK